MHEENRKYQKISKIPLIQQNLEEKKNSAAKYSLVLKYLSYIEAISFKNQLEWLLLILLLVIKQIIKDSLNNGPKE